jgi:hypothetical protein
VSTGLGSSSVADVAADKSTRAAGSLLVIGKYTYNRLVRNGLSSSCTTAQIMSLPDQQGTGFAT